MRLAVHPNDSRAFHAAVLFSIVLHGLLLFAIPRYEPSFQPATEAPPLVARLVEPAPPPVKADPRPPAPQPPPQQRRKPKPLAKSLPQAPASRVETAPIEAPSEEATAEPPVRAQEPPAVGEDAREQAQTNAAQPKAEPPPAQEEPVAPPFDPAALAKYRLEVISLARQFKRYPPLARENNWEGRAEVRLSFGADGKRPSVDLLKSSGYTVLDRQAVDTLSKALAPLPPALRGRQFALDIPVIFNLDD